MSDRKIVLKRIFIFCALGITYYIWIRLTGLSIPCPVRLISGGRILCPGCGITTLCVNVLAGNFKAAFDANPCLFIMLPIWFIFILIRLIFQPKCLSDRQPLNQAFYITMSVILFVFGILRNIF